MKNTLFAAAFSLLFASFSFAQTDEINIIPKPRIAKYGSGSFALRKDTRIVVLDETSKVSAGILNEYILKDYGFRLRVVNKSEKRNAITFLPVAVDSSGGEINEIKREKYSLNIKPDQVYIGGTNAGQFYAIQSLVQILPIEFSKEARLPVLNIVDSPRFPYRGMHLDVARHFMPVSFVKKYIDLMSQYKFNYFHWHLTEDQGWRIEIKKYPRLTGIGSKRPESVKGRNLTPYVGDGIPVEGFYTQDEIRDVVAYAKARYITVIPEIELPGHASAALAAYPQFGCKADYKYKVQTTWGIFKEVYCPTDETFKFLEDILDETIALFPDSPYVHIGGDEVLKDHWKESAFVQELKKRENLKDEHEVQSYFVRRIEKYINSKGKKMIGWDEILEGGLAPNATVMSWRGMKGGIEAAKAKHDVIMTPTDYVYFDYGQGDPAAEPLNIGGYVTLEKVYSYDPVPKELTSDEAKFILGAQANIWTEYLKTPEKVEYMAFPRMLALAEVVWSAPENKNYADFLKRLSAHFPRLDKQDVNYRIPEPTGLSNGVIPNDGALGMEVRSIVPGAKVLGTVDGSEPTEKSPPFPEKFVAHLPNGEILIVKTIVVLPTGRKSSVYTTTFLKRDHLQPVSLQEKRPGVTYGFAGPRADGLAETVVVSGETKTIGLQQFAKTADLKQMFAVAFDGYFNAPVDGIYEFQADSTWDAGLWIGGEKLFDDAGTKNREIRTGLIPLKSGWHKISMKYNNRGGDPFFRVRWALKGRQWQNIGGGELVH